MKSTAIFSETEAGSTSMLSFEQRQRLDQLSIVIGGEQATRDQLADAEAEIARNETALAPIRDKRAELKQRLGIIAQAKSDARSIKGAPAATVTRNSPAPSGVHE
jgi:chromosome segregation ATPase